jgi:hypothetical protein
MIAVCFNIKGYEKHMTFGKQYHVIVMTAWHRWNFETSREEALRRSLGNE